MDPGVRPSRGAEVYRPAGLLLRASPVRLSALLILLATGAAQAVDSKGTDPPATKAPAANYEALLEKALTADRVRVIVRLQVQFAAEGRLANPKAVMDQRLSIARTQDSLLQRLQPYAMGSVKRFKYSPYIAMEVDAAALEALRASPEVADIVEDVAVPPLLPNSVPHIGADQAWAQGFAGAGQSVAILDTGVDKFHAFLSGKVVAEACFSTTSIVGLVSSLCPNGADQQIGSGAGVNCSGVSECDHGTHVAGIAAGRGADFSGVARDASIISVQVFSRVDDPFSCFPFLDPCLTSFFSDLMLALEWLYTQRATFAIAAVNMSLGGGVFTTHCDSNPLKPSIDNLRSAGIATVVAGGNDFSCVGISEPACISTAISVGATDNSDNVAVFTNAASILDLFAPGVDITSSLPGNAFGVNSGTSMAAPHVAGTWAVLKSRSPFASVDTILSALQSTGVNVTDQCSGVTKPRIQVDAALMALSEPTRTIITSDQPDPSDAGQLVTVSFNVAATATGVGTPTGNVTVRTDGGNPMCTGALDGSGGGSCTLSFGFPGNYTLTATYPGDANFDTSTSPGVDHQVTAGAGAGASDCDFNGDLLCDILWRNMGTGVNEVWFMDGLTRLSSGSILPRTNLSWRIGN